jgi:hypothetical protein
MVHWKLTPKGLASLEYKDFMTMARAYSDEERRKNETLRINSARTSWLLGADRGVSFGAFITKWGIVEKKSIDTGKVDTEALYEKADRITQQLKQKGLL